MICFFLGGSACGKSRLAEKRASEFCGKKIYFATLDRNSGGDTKNRIEKHRKQREKFNFQTVELLENESGFLFLKNGSILEFDEAFIENSSILVEDIGNLAARVHFGAKKRTQAESKKIVLDFAQKICRKCKNAVFVSNEICLEPIAQEKSIVEYCSILAAANSFLANTADESFFVAAGIPVKI